MKYLEIYNYLENQWEKSQESFIGSNESELDFKVNIAEWISGNFLFVDKKKKSCKKIYRVVRTDGEKRKGVLKSIVCISENDLQARSLFNETTIFPSHFFTIKEIGYTDSDCVIIERCFN